MDQIDEYKQVGEDQQGNGRAKVVPQDQRDTDRRGTTTIGPREILLGILDLLLPK